MRKSNSQKYAGPRTRDVTEKSLGGGGRAESILDIGTEYRTVSFSIGGEGTWRDMVTLPNLLKLFNPDLYGASRYI